MPTHDLVVGEYIDASAPTTDAWGSPFAITCKPAHHFRVTSPGTDRRLGTADDIE